MGGQVLYILVDSSNKPTGKDNQYGESTASWAAYREVGKGSTPWRCGVIYHKYEGPNKIFYHGIIQALRNCLPMINTTVIVVGDCTSVIDQLRMVRGVAKMQQEYRKVMTLVEEYKASNNTVHFSYLGETSATYRRVDKFAKKSRELIASLFNNDAPPLELERSEAKQLSK